MTLDPFTQALRWEWPTLVWAGTAPGPLPVGPDGAHGTRDADLGCDVEREFARSIEQAAAALGADGELRWRHRLEAWPPGHHVALRYGPGTIEALCIVASDGRAGQAASGQISLHDPRTGAGNVCVPGLPWGRPITMPADVGRMLIFPGWLAYSIAPLHGEHHMVVWSASASA